MLGRRPTCHFFWDQQCIVGQVRSAMHGVTTIELEQVNDHLKRSRRLANGLGPLVARGSGTNCMMTCVLH